MTLSGTDLLHQQRQVLELLLPVQGAPDDDRVRRAAALLRTTVDQIVDDDILWSSLSRGRPSVVRRTQRRDRHGHRLAAPAQDDGLSTASTT